MTAEPLPVYDTMAIPTSEEKNWAMIAHLSGLVNLFTGILGPVAANYLPVLERSFTLHRLSSPSVAHPAAHRLGGRRDDRGNSLDRYRPSLAGFGRPVHDPICHCALYHPGHCANLLYHRCH